MTARDQMREQEIPPRVSVPVDGLRDLGYSLQAAVADIVDDSLTAGTHEVNLLADTHAEAPTIDMIDDVSDMTEPELPEAMRPGSESALKDRAFTNLVRLGFGLEMQLFAQCRQLTVVTQRGRREVLRSLGSRHDRGARQVDGRTSSRHYLDPVARTLGCERNLRRVRETRPSRRSGWLDVTLPSDRSGFASPRQVAVDIVGLNSDN